MTDGRRIRDCIYFHCAAEEVFDMNKQIVLEGLLYKYPPKFINKGVKYIEGLREKTRVFKITINELTGKARKQ